MNKSEFIDKVAEKAELSRAAASRVVDAIFDAAEGAISEAVHAAGSLSIPGFGKFTKKERPARAGRNPRTGVEIAIPARTSVGFSAGKNLRTATPSGRRRAAGDTVSGTAGGGTATRAPAKKSAASAPAKKSAASGPAKSGGAAKKSAAPAKKAASGPAKKSPGGKAGGR
ncbi:MAG TPA: HU family DNA-binding protein [Longimicrobiaceae bacterium]|nr:HU family DNA-binding protein [Longimicrobiaceae bacterium]